MDEFPGNSINPHKKVAEPKKKIEKVIEGPVIRKKQSMVERFFETFSLVNTKTVMETVVMDVLIPGAKDMIFDAAREGLEMKLYGAGVGRRRGSRRDNGLGHVDYQGRYRGSSLVQKEDPRQSIMSRRSRATHNFDDIILPSRIEADEVIDGLFNIISQYEVVTVSDLYGLVGEPAEFTDNNWGWTDIRGAKATRARNGYLLDLPKPEPLD